MAKLLAIANDDEDVKYYELPEYELIPHGICKSLEFKGEGKMKKHVNTNMPIVSSNTIMTAQLCAVH